jgi:hypothetical protein
MYTAVVFLDVEKTFETTWHPGCLLHELSNLQLSTSIIKLISSFLSSYYSESELCGCAVTVSFPKYLPWQVMHFL